MAGILFDAAVWTAGVFVVATFGWLVGDVLWHGLGVVSIDFLTEMPHSAGRRGGIGPILVSTLLILAVCMAVALPVGVATAMLLSEYTAGNSLFGRLVRRSLDTLAGVPSIVFGLFGNALFCRFFGWGFSIFSGGLTLACMVLPLLIRATEEGFRSVPETYRTAAAALGFSRTATLLRIVLPVGAPGIVVGLVLGIGRALAETAALLFTSGYVDRMPGSMFDSGRALSIHIYDLAMNVPGGNANAYGAALVLIGLLLAINALASWLTKHLLHRNVTSV